MSDRFEKFIKDWYEQSRIADLEYLNLEIPKPVSRSFTNKIEFVCFNKNHKEHSSNSTYENFNFLCDSVLLGSTKSDYIFDRLGLFSRVCFKHFPYFV